MFAYDRNISTILLSINEFSSRPIHDFTLEPGGRVSANVELGGFGREKDNK